MRLHVARLHNRLRINFDFNLGVYMKKRAFLAPVAVSLAGLLTGIPQPSQASNNPNSALENPTKVTKGANSFVLKRSAGRDGQLAQDYHVSHASHDSHASHESHVSGY